MLKIEHVGIAVKALALSEPLFTKLLGVSPYKRERVESEGVDTSFFQAGPNKIELLGSITSDGVIARYVEKHGEGMHHIAFEVADIVSEMERLRQEGFTLLSPEPRRGADNKLVCFLHPKSTGGVLVELCQEIPD